MLYSCLDSVGIMIGLVINGLTSILIWQNISE